MLVGDIIPERRLFWSLQAIQPGGPIVTHHLQADYCSAGQERVAWLDETWKPALLTAHSLCDLLDAWRPSLARTTPLEPEVKDSLVAYCAGIEERDLLGLSIFLAQVGQIGYGHGLDCAFDPGCFDLIAASRLAKVALPIAVEASQVAERLRHWAIAYDDRSSSADMARLWGKAYNELICLDANNPLIWSQP